MDKENDRFPNLETGKNRGNAAFASHVSSIPGYQRGYLFISKDVVSMRKDCLTQEECLSKIERWRKTHNNAIVAGVFGPIFMCAQAARLRNLDLQVAASDAANWAKTGLCPLRPTPIIGSASSSGPSPADKKWWEFWK